MVIHSNKDLLGLRDGEPLVPSGVASAAVEALDARPKLLVEYVMLCGMRVVQGDIQR